TSRSRSTPEERRNGPHHPAYPITLPLLLLSAEPFHGASLTESDADLIFAPYSHPSSLKRECPIEDNILDRVFSPTGKPGEPMAQSTLSVLLLQGAPAPSHSCSLDQRRRPETLRTAIATAFFWPTSTTSCLPRVTPV